MRIRNKWLIIVLVLTPLLFTGCFGSRSQTDYAYDGTPTSLKVVLKRNAVQSKSLTAYVNPYEDDYINVRIWKTDGNGRVIYSVVREVLLEDLETDYTLAETVPADQGYNVTAIYADRKGTFEVGQTKVNAPAKTLTTASVQIAPLNYTLHKPDVAYSGGDMNQFWVEFPESLESALYYTVYLGMSPWDGNGGGTWYTSKVTNKPLPEITEPKKLYYQVRTFAEDGYYRYIRPYVYYPDIEQGKELPYIWFYPSPER